MFGSPVIGVRLLVILAASLGEPHRCSAHPGIHPLCELGLIPIETILIDRVPDARDLTGIRILPEQPVLERRAARLTS